MFFCCAYHLPPLPQRNSIVFPTRTNRCPQVSFVVPQAQEITDPDVNLDLVPPSDIIVCRMSHKEMLALASRYESFETTIVKHKKLEERWMHVLEICYERMNTSNRLHKSVLA